MIRAGMILLPEKMPEREDARNAAQAILIGYIETRLMRALKRPTLAPGGEFYSQFFTAYADAIRTEELRIWEEIGCEVDQALAEQPERDLTEKEAGYLTITMLGSLEPPQSEELYMNLAVFARAYEELVRKKYGEQYEAAVFYRALREHMPRFMFGLISMSSIISMLITINAKTERLVGETLILRPETVLDPRFMQIGADDSFSFLPKFVDAIHEHARVKNIREDSVGRTEDRGCPVLYASNRDAIIRFAIEELIAQHAAYEYKT